MKLSSKFKIAESKKFKKIIKQAEFEHFYQRMRKVIYPQLKTNPFFGPNIKRLKGELEGLYRYRIGDYRLIYKVEKDKVIVFIITLKHRKESY